MIMTTRRFEQLVKERVAREMMSQNVDYERDILKKQMDIAFLQSQINPHFLYNTLECIRGQALKEGIDDIANTVRALAQFFRYSISVKGNIVTIEDEITNVNYYIIIQQYRFRNKFKVEVNIDEKDVETLLMCKVPKLMLQPIVENAIVHGYSDMRQGGKLEISIRKAGKNVLISVRDNGKGMSPDHLVALRKRVNEKTEIQNTGQASNIGLRNVNNRICLLFGSEYGINIESAKGEGTTVEILLPEKVNWDGL